MLNFWLSELEDNKSYIVLSHKVYGNLLQQQ